MNLLPQVLELSLKPTEFESVLYPKIRDAVFHYSTGEKYEKILKSGYLASSNTVELVGTSLYSDVSAGKFLKAVCLFDLRNKTDEQIAPGKSYYDFLKPFSQLKKVVYFVVSKKYYADLKIFSDLDDHVKKHTMYLPVIESWHVGHLPLEKLESIYVVNIL
jgi:hypothetical protein